MYKHYYKSVFTFFHCPGRVLFILLFLSSLNTSVIYAQTQTLVISPGPADGIGALIRTDFPTTPLGITYDFTSNAWTVGGDFVILRSLIYFDISVLPTNTTIISATLSLYCNLTSGYYQLQSGDNQSDLLVVTQNWDKNTVTWDNQPSTTMQNVVLLPTSTSNTQDYPNINVTVPVQNMVTNPSTNFGWMIKFITEQLYRSMVFESFANQTASRRPILTIVFCPSIPAGGNITGPTYVCPGDSGKVYTVPPIPGATGYSWTLPPGAQITAGNNMNTITVRYSISATSGNITVHGTNLCATGPPSPSLYVTVRQFTIPSITGPDSACVGQTGLIYSTEPGKTNYVWTITAGGIITGGWGTDSITVTWNTPGSQKLTVNYLDANSCVNPNPAEYHVRVNPHLIQTISGNDSLCIESGYTDYWTESGMFNYLWTTSGGGTIANGQGTDHIHVSWNIAGQQWVSVTYADSLGCTPVDSTIYNIMVYDFPDTTGNIYGPAIVCTGMNNVSYAVAPVSNVISYTWTLPPGTTITSGAGTNSIGVDFSLVATSGNITAYATNLCGDGEPSPSYFITVDLSPTADAGPDQSILYATSARLSGTVDQGSGTYAYDWEPAALLIDNTISQPETVILTTDTTFTLTITDLITGCKGSDSVRVKVAPPENVDDCIVIHNVITPNGDGMNDAWIIDCIEEYPDNKVVIYNRWGNEVNTFEKYNNTSEVWKGTNHKGNLLPDGTYYYILTIKNAGTHSGWVILRAGSE